MVFCDFIRNHSGTYIDPLVTSINLKAIKGSGIHNLRFFAYHTCCIWNKILTLYVDVGGPFAHI